MTPGLIIRKLVVLYVSWDQARAMRGARPAGPPAALDRARHRQLVE